MIKFSSARIFILTLSYAKSCEWGGFSTFLRWRSRVFFKSDLTDPPQIFDAHLLENTDLSPSRFHFSVGFISRSCFESDGFIAYSNEWDWREKTMFIHTNQPLITSFYIKRCLFFAELAMSQRWSALFCATGAWGIITCFINNIT